MPLLGPVQIGAVTTQHRIVMGPLTRFRANDDFTPSALQEKYYLQRASVPGTLIVSEATYISERAGGYFNAPGIWNKSQIEGWTRIGEAVHGNGCHMFLQLWALGRVASSRFDSYIGTKEGMDLVAPSPIADHTQRKLKVPRELSVEEIKGYVCDYAQAAKNAVFEAGLDGVEIQAGNGYLIDQFLHENSNHRTDEYGGCLEKRARFLLDVVDAVIEAVGADRVGIRLTPWENFQDIKQSISPMRTFGHVLMELEKRAQSGSRLAYVHIVEPCIVKVFKDIPAKNKTNDWVRTFWKGVWIRAGGFTRETAFSACSHDPKILVSFGRLFIANPDLVKRLSDDLPLHKPHPATFYIGGDAGYTDYPFYNSVGGRRGSGNWLSTDK